MSTAKRRRPFQRRHTRRRIVLATVVGGLVLILGATAWVGARALLAKNELEMALPLATQLKEYVLARDEVKIRQTAAEFAQHIDKAASLTSDPLWRSSEAVPWVGPNLSAFRAVTSAVHDLSNDAIEPLAELASSVNITNIKPVDGALDLTPLIEARPVMERAATAVQVAQEDLAAINTDATIHQLRAATGQLSDQLETVAVPIQTLRTVTALVPDMLGASGPRDYLLLFQNPAELRASGGIAGALALVHTDGGRMELTQQASSADFPPFETPVLPLSDETLGLYGSITGEYIQDVNLTPQFALSAALAREMWARQFGVHVSGVIAVDAVAVSYLLEESGPITMATGDQLTAENAVDMLLRDVYTRYDKPSMQDLFFASAASSVFEAVTAGELDSASLIGALTKAGAERRIRLWSAHEGEQSMLSRSSLAGGLPEGSDTQQPFGIYLNDGTEGKMSYYLDVQAATGQIECRQDRRPHFGVSVTLANRAPADAGESLPKYVTGGGRFDIEPGSVRTIVTVYGTPGLQNLGVVRDGEAVPYLPATDSGHPVSQISIELAPGESTTLHFGFLGETPFGGEISVDQTPVINLHETKKLALSCESPLW